MAPLNPVIPILPADPTTTVVKIPLPGEPDKVAEEITLPAVNMAADRPATQLSSTDAWKAMSAFRDEVNAALVNRHKELDLLLMGLLTRQHVLLVGPPGVAKSALCDALCRAISGARIFSVLCSRSMDIADIMGGLDIGRLHRDGVETMRVDGFLPTAEFAFLDEIWNADGGILNALLKVLNERTYWNRGVKCAAPLQTALAASNQYPDITSRSELKAIYDRFLLRASVAPLKQRQHIERLVFPQRSPVPEVSGMLSFSLIEIMQQAAMRVPYTTEAREAYLAILAALQTEGLPPSDRRMAHAVHVGQAAAVLAGADAVSPRHLVAMSHVLWDKSDREQQVSKLILQTVDPEAHDLLHEIGVVELVLDEIEAAAGTASKTQDGISAQSGRMKKVAASMARVGTISKARKLTAEEAQILKDLQTRVHRNAYLLASAATLSGLGNLTHRN